MAAETDSGRLGSEGLGNLTIERLFDSLSIAVSVVDLRGRQVAANSPYLDLFGLSRADLSAIDVADLTHPADRDRTQHYLAEMVSGRLDSHDIEKRYLRRDGTVFWGQLRATVLRAADGTPEFLVGTIEDISERVQQRDELRATHDAVARSSAAKTELVAHVSHELRNPLHAVSGLAGLLIDDGTSDDGRLLATTIQETVTHLNSVLDELLELSSLESDTGTRALRLGKVDVPALARQVIALFQTAEVGLELDGDVDVAWSDHTSLRQVMTNLVGNAVKFDPDGPVTLRIAIEDQDLVITVEDHGKGISPDDLPHLFEPYVRARGEDRPGHGLGLTITRRLVQLLGGTIAVTSELGQGATFEVRVPHHHPSIGPRSPGDAPPRVVVVEDEPVNQLLARRQLERLGFEAVVFGDGESFLDADPTCDIILMDWRLPGIDGLETTLRFRSRQQAEGRPHVPIVAVTASALPGDRERCLDAGMDDLAAKPLSIQMLQRTVQEHVRTRPLPPGPTPSTEEIPTEEIIDGSTLLQLADDLGGRDAVARLIGTFLPALQERLGEIDSAAAMNDASQLLDSAHALKSPAALLGALRLAAMAEALEHAVRGGDSHHVAVEAVLEAGALVGGPLRKWAATLGHDDA